MTHVVILSLDPGTGNFGFAVLSGELKREVGPQLKVLRFGRNFSTIREIKQGINYQASQYWAFLESMYKEYGVTHIVGERYQSRRMGGSTIESVNIMIGITLAFARLHKLPCKFIPASQWKNELNRNGVELVEVYQSVKGSKVTPHAVDAVSIGEYAAYRLVGLKPFSETVNETKRAQHVLRFVENHVDFGVKAKVAKKAVRRARPSAGKRGGESK